ncbi:MAG: hypothetical protein D6692_02570 [Planctomycetota bacterium]|nr:MAG: hypothetical protein D6692_02570 [Planctomycetota bacterium]
MNRNRLITTALLGTSFLAVFAAAPVAASNGESRQGMNQRNDRTEYRADLDGSGTLMSGKARYREQARRGAVSARLDIEVEDAQPDTTYEVTLNGTVIGEITTNGLGIGEITFRFPSDDVGDLPDVPSVSAGDEIAVGPVSGVMG